jgi:uncharacterized protein (DUF433 family)
MATLDWSRCPVAESVPRRVGGARVFRGTRLPVVIVIENLEDLSIEEVIEQFGVTRGQIVAVLDFAARSLRESGPRMFILFDLGTPAGLARAFSPHTVGSVRARGRDRLTNGLLPTAAASAAFDLLVTTDLISRISPGERLRWWCSPAARKGRGFACILNGSWRR